MIGNVDKCGQEMKNDIIAWISSSIPHINYYIWYRLAVSIKYLTFENYCSGWIKILIWSYLLGYRCAFIGDEKDIYVLTFEFEVHRL